MKISRIRLCLFFMMIVFISCSPVKNRKTAYGKTNNPTQQDSFFIRLLQQYPQYFDTLLQQNQAWGIQIVYTKIDRKRNNKPRFTQYQFNTAGRRYFYPASTVKLPTAVLALQKLNTLNITGLNRDTTMITGKARAAQTGMYNDPTTADGRPTVAHYIKRSSWLVITRHITGCTNF